MDRAILEKIKNVNKKVVLKFDYPVLGNKIMNLF
jgi:hypothetical protein